MINAFTEINKVKKEITELETWFKKYDIQVMQYQRDLRVKGKSDIDIVALDIEAYENAAKIKELRNYIPESLAVIREAVKNSKSIAELFPKK